MAWSYPYEIFIGLRYLKAKRRQRAISTITFISIAGVAVGFEAPFLAAVSLAILLTEGGPVLFAHERVGRGGRPFRCLKFRTMHTGAHALQGELGSKDFQVVAVNIDTRDPDKPKRFLKDIGVQKRVYYAGSSAQVFQDRKAIGRAFGMPTTMLIDRQGCEIGTIAGTADWASPDAVKLIKAALGQ